MGLVQIAKKSLIVIRNVITTIGLYVCANRMIGHFPEVKSRRNRVNLYDYRPDMLDYSKDRLYNGSRYNLGDYLGWVVTEWMLQKKGLSLETPIKGRKFLNTVGSNIFQSYQNATIWGSGMLHEPLGKMLFLFRKPFIRLDVRAVRGPKSREVVLKYGHKCPEVYGDPAVLMPLIYTPNVKEEKNELLLIPQYLAEGEIRSRYPDYKTISLNTNDYAFVIDAIVSSKMVVTSSLHAVLLAEVYGVPAVLFRTLEKEVDFKYYDYYYGTGRFDVKIADTMEEALLMTPPPIPDFSEMQQKLMASFPYDLWEHKKCGKA